MDEESLFLLGFHIGLFAGVTYGQSAYDKCTLWQVEHGRYFLRSGGDRRARERSRAVIGLVNGSYLDCRRSDRIDRGVLRAADDVALFVRLDGRRAFGEHGDDRVGRDGVVAELFGERGRPDEIFADESYTVYTDIYADGHRDYDFQTWGSLRKDYEYCGMVVRDQIRHVIATQPTDVIRLTWSHNGNTYTTKALASPDEGIIYDNVATYAVQDVYILDEESTNSGERGFKKEVRSVNVIDLPLWEVNLAASSTFDTEGILRDRRSHCDMYNSKGWECTASAVFNSDKCKINESKYNEILWEYGGTDNRGAQYVTTSDGYPMGSSSASGSVTHGRE